MSEHWLRRRYRPYTHLAVAGQMKTLLPLLLATSSSGFLITEAEPGLVLVSPGQKVTLFCAVDDDYEWCKFYHPDGRFCDFEWKRRKGNITMQECQLAGKVRVFLWLLIISDNIFYFL